MERIIWGIMTPLIGTGIGAAFVFFVKRGMGSIFRQVLTGTAGGIMTAASVWSLLLPAIDRSRYLGAWSFVPAAAGFLGGVFGMLILERVVPESIAGRSTGMMLTAVIIHNVPEGVAVGVAFAGCAVGDGVMTLAGAFALAVGIAIQNIPEGAIVSIPLCASGKGKFVSFLMGLLSGAVEPISAGIALAFSEISGRILPYLLSVAAGAMVYVVTAELVPETVEPEGRTFGIVSFALGFVLMMSLDCAFG